MPSFPQPAEDPTSRPPQVRKTAHARLHPPVLPWPHPLAPSDRQRSGAPSCPPAGPPERLTPERLPQPHDPPVPRTRWGRPSREGRTRPLSRLGSHNLSIGASCERRASPRIPCRTKPEASARLLLLQPPAPERTISLPSRVRSYISSPGKMASFVQLPRSNGFARTSPVPPWASFGETPTQHFPGTPSLPRVRSYIASRHPNGFARTSPRSPLWLRSEKLSANTSGKRRPSLGFARTSLHAIKWLRSYNPGSPLASFVQPSDHRTPGTAYISAKSRTKPEAPARLLRLPASNPPNEPNISRLRFARTSPHPAPMASVVQTSPMDSPLRSSAFHCAAPPNAD